MSATPVQPTKSLYNKAKLINVKETRQKNQRETSIASAELSVRHSLVDRHRTLTSTLDRHIRDYRPTEISAM